MRAGGEIAYVAVGANLGDRDATFARVIAALQRASQILLVSASPVFETEPLGADGQGAYLNAVLALRTWLSPHDLLGGLQSIEARLGRDRSREPQRWGPREVDLDILFYGDRCIDAVDLVVPHPRAHERAFVMRPLAAIAPDFVHPKLGLAVAELAELLRTTEDEVRAWPRPPGWPGAAEE